MYDLVIGSRELNETGATVFRSVARNDAARLRRVLLSSFGGRLVFDPYREGCKGFVRPTSGYTLLELMFAVAIAVVLTLIAISQFSKAIERSKVGSAMADISEIQMEIERYRSNNAYKLPDAMISDRLDPWGRPYFYTKLEGVKGHGSARKDRALNPLNTDYDLFSAGKNGVYKPQVSQKDSLDDIIRARNGAYVGLAEDF